MRARLPRVVEGLFALAVLAVSGLACPKPPTPAPSYPDASDAAPVVDPGPVPRGDPTKCAIVARHADQVCPGSLEATAQACTRAGGANPSLVTCWTASTGCDDLTACGRPASAAGAVGPHGR